MPLQKIIGIHSCREALKARSAKELKKIYLKVNWQSHPALKELADLAQAKNLKPELASLKKLNQIGESHQGVCVLAKSCLKFDIRSAGKNSIALVLDRLQDPKNLGAVIRTAWLMDVDCVFVSSRHSAGLSPSVFKSASGGAEHTPVEFRDSLRQCLEELKKNQYWIYGLDSRSKKSLWEENFEGRTAFVFGGEFSGLRKSLAKICDESLAIPQKQKGASYNVSVAVGLVLAERLRQRSLNV